MVRGDVRQRWLGWGWGGTERGRCDGSFGSFQQRDAWSDLGFEGSSCNKKKKKSLFKEVIYLTESFWLRTRFLHLFCFCQIGLVMTVCRYTLC